MNPGLRAGTLELISSRSSLKHVTDSDGNSAINCDQRASDHRDLSKIYYKDYKDLIRRVIYWSYSSLKCFYELYVGFI